MKRLALLLAAVAACVLFTACPNKPTDNVYYSEDIALYRAWPQEDRDTTTYFRQEFTMNGNTLIYNPTSVVNSERPYVWFTDGTNPICSIVNDTIIYFTFLDADRILINRLPNPIKAKVNWIGKKREEFTFSYPLFDRDNYIVSATHTCHRIKSLSE